MDSYNTRDALNLGRERKVARFDSATVSYSDIDWTVVTSASVTVGSGKWPVGAGVGKAAASLQNKAIDLLGNVSEGLATIDANNDLTPQAKDRYRVEMMDALADELAPLSEALESSWASVVESAEEQFDPTTKLHAQDAVGASQDVELRGVIRGMEPGKRSEILARATAGKHPELVQAILRASPLASGLSDESVSRLRSAGIAAAHGEAIAVLKSLALVSFDANQTAISVIKQLLQKGKVGHHARLDKLTKRNPTRVFNEWAADLPGV